MTDETTRRAQDKFSATVFRILRQPAAVQIRQEHDADMGALHQQAEKARKAKESRHYGQAT